MARQAVIGSGGGSGLVAKLLTWAALIVTVVFVVKEPEQAARLFLVVLDAVVTGIDAGVTFLSSLS